MTIDLIPRPGPGSQRPLVLGFGYAGGGSRSFRGWADRLAPEFGFSSVVLPGREHLVREEPYRRMADLIGDLVRSVAPLAGRPIVLFGHSMGATVAFALAVELRRLGLGGARALVLSAAASPERRDPKDTHRLDDEGFWLRILGYGGLPDEILAEPELRDLFAGLLRADFELIETYQPGPVAPLAIPVTLLTGTDDRSTSTYQVDGWRSHTTGAVRTVTIAGGHFFIDTNSSAVIDAVRTAAAEASSDWGGYRCVL